MTKESVVARREEFFNSVWNHSEDAFQAAFDDRRDLNIGERAVLKSLMSCFRDGATDDEAAEFLRRTLNKDGSRRHIEVMLQICGITRNKILQDLKAAAGPNRKKLRLSNHLMLASHAPTWAVAGPYLAKKLRTVLYLPQVRDADDRMLEALNKATWAGYIRQERAKRSGHEAEYRIATLLSKLGIPFVPQEKADNPLCRDAQLNGVSFDIIVPDLDSPRICIKSTVHTSNIGQYGESKDHLEVDEARRMIDKLPERTRPRLFGFIDGVGFESNRAGLDGVLEKTDEFCQFSTIWKLVVVCAEALGRKCRLYLTNDKIKLHRRFLDRYGRCVVFEKKPFAGSIPAGDGLVGLR